MYGATLSGAQIPMGRGDHSPPPQAQSSKGAWEYNFSGESNIFTVRSLIHYIIIFYIEDYNHYYTITNSQASNCSDHAWLIIYKVTLYNQSGMITTSYLLFDSAKSDLLITTQPILNASLYISRCFFRLHELIMKLFYYNYTVYTNN